MQVVILNVYLIFHVFTCKILIITCLNKHTMTQNSLMFLSKEGDNFESQKIIIRRCCSETETLLKDSKSSKYSCIEKEENGTRLDFIEISESLIGIPECKIQTKHEKCVDLLNNRAVEVFCAHSTIAGKILYVLSHRPLAIMRKCCSGNEIYDSAHQKCVTHQNGTHLNRKYFNQFKAHKGHIVIANETFPISTENQIIVQYNFNINDTNFPFKPEFMTHLTPELKSYDYCIDLTMNHNEFHWMLQVSKSKDICKSIPCIRKCCLVGEQIKIINGSSECAPYKGSIKPKFYNIQNWYSSNQIIEEKDVDVYGIRQQKNCKKYILDPFFTFEDIHYIDYKTGNLFVNASLKPFKHDQYCLEIVGDVMETFICQQDESNETNYYKAVALMLSIIGFALTLIVYILFPKQLHGNIHGKIVMCYDISFLLAYTSLLIIQFIYANSKYCKIIAYLTYFNFITGFIWTNIMCFDIWLTIVKGASRSSKRLIFYIGYSITFSGALLMILCLAQHTELMPYYLRPDFGETKCWFNDRDTMILGTYFLFPLGLIILVNSVFFILTIIHCNKVKREITRAQRTSVREKKKRLFQANKAIISMNLKLFIVMGMSWILEVISALDSKRIIYYITDTFNALLGVFIFIIFVCKGRVLQLIKKRLGIQEEPVQITRTTSASAKRTHLIDTKATKPLQVQVVECKSAEE
uniref:CSON013820 protein n=1 Tax=Culicoides sonorensis TaxID=179676 RepID=A0A336MEK8_CULSO